MAEYQAMTDQELLESLRRSDKVAYRTLFDRYYKYLVVTAYNILGDAEQARDLAQDVFLEVWRRRETLQVMSRLKPYLRRAVVNKTLNVIKARRLDFNQPETLEQEESTSNSVQQDLERDELQQMIDQAIASLPERCRLVFTLCRLEGLSHQEIATKLGISTKTIENQMTKAMKVLRAAIVAYRSAGGLLLWWYCWWLG